MERVVVERYSDSSSCGGPCAPGNGGVRGGSRPRLRSISSAARRLVTMAITFRLPPQRQVHRERDQKSALHQGVLI